MAFWSRWFETDSPRAAAQSSSGGVLITSAADLDRYLKEGSRARSGALVTPETSLQVSAVFACVRLIAGAVATMPLDIKRRVDDRTREDASDTRLWQLMRRRPNPWQKPGQFRRMLQAHILLRGNAYCHIVRSRGEILMLVPLQPDRVEPKLGADMRLRFEYRRPDGGLTIFAQSEILHLFGLTLDGVKGVTPLTYARETIGLSLAMEDAGATSFRIGMRAAGVLEHPQKLSADSRKNLKDSLADYRAGGESEGGVLILEEGMKQAALQMNAEDAQWIEARKFSRSDIAMFFGVPPHMIGDTEKSTSWGSGIEQQSLGFVAYTLQDWLTTWEETITRDLIADPEMFARFNPAGLIRGDIKTRYAAYAVGRQWGWLSVNDIRGLEDMNPIEGGDTYLEPLNTQPLGTEPTRDDPQPDAAGQEDIPS